MKKPLKIVLLVLAAVLLVVISYLAYVLIDYHRLGDMDLEVDRQVSQPAQTGCEYHLLSYNIGFGGIDLGKLDIILKPAVMNGDKEVTAAVTLGLGTFLTTIIDFILVAFVIFLMVKAINAFHKKKDEAPAPEEPAGPTTEELLTEIRDLLKEQK